MKPIILLVALACLSGCQRINADSDLRQIYGPAVSGVMEIGPPPSEDAVMAAAKAELQLTLKDAESARFAFKATARGYVRNGSPKNTIYGWVGIVMVNGKNSYGAYSGFKPFYIFFGAGKPIDITELVESNGAGVY